MVNTTKPNAPQGLEPEALATLRIGHLGMIQGIIGRMSAASAAFKGFCITVTGGLIALGGDDLGRRVWWLFPLALLFALCDAAYLGMERQFRDLYQTVAARPMSEAADVAIQRPSGNASAFADALRSWAVLGFYGAIFALIIGAVVTS